MKAESYFGLFVAAGIGLAAFAGCSSSKDSTTDATSASSASSTASSSHAASSSSSAVASSSSGSVNSNLGQACTADADCGGDLKCSLSTADDAVFAGGPAGGYCTKSCQSASDCPSNGSCLSATDMGPKQCLLNCAIGPDLMYLDDPLDPNKCQGREDLRCVSLSNTDAVCLPTCGEDAQCEGGRVCDPRLSVCVDAAKVSTGDALGSKCDSMAMDPTCAGTCISFTGSNLSMCTQACALGGELDSTDCGGLAKGLCVFSPSGFGAGDQGFCTNACTKHDECQNPDWWCFSTNFQMGNGYCFTAVDCPNGDSDCVDANMQPLKQKCHDTKYGPKCIDDAWPLGSAAPDDAGAGDAGMGAADAGAGDGG